MDLGLGLLTFGTLGAAAMFAKVGEQQMRDRRKTGAPKSTLAADAPARRTGITAAE